jgi:hypothetical protein
MKNARHTPKPRIAVAKVEAPGIRPTPLGAVLIASAMAVPFGLALALLRTWF